MSLSYSSLISILPDGEPGYMATFNFQPVLKLPQKNSLVYSSPSMHAPREEALADRICTQETNNFNFVQKFIINYENNK